MTIILKTLEGKDYVMSARCEKCKWNKLEWMDGPDGICHCPDNCDDCKRLDRGE